MATKYLDQAIFYIIFLISFCQAEEISKLLSRELIEPPFIILQSVPIVTNLPFWWAYNTHGYTECVRPNETQNQCGTAYCPPDTVCSMAGKCCPSTAPYSYGAGQRVIPCYSNETACKGNCMGYCKVLVVITGQPGDYVKCEDDCLQKTYSFSGFCRQNFCRKR
ncbi:UNKNOWN [Stylonychia lemnae]|uniref:WAP domain-containing protein n=1 Tax=Stylonychia lemnae TaxID=5949 RepID=A0A078AKT9_STYLE|nr:UNKNOWN [Stylonychia lemnae]|eukprot:CDW82990.1 UNKNOWN [Stylonychia lemnae]